jgi:hypothetical protein
MHHVFGANYWTPKSTDNAGSIAKMIMSVVGDKKEINRIQILHLYW